jgi:ribosomal protein S18 acetylase RimI-like enzyme
VSDGDKGRIVEAFRWVEDVTSTRIVPSPLGTALYNDDVPERYDSNFLRVEGSDGTLDATEVIAEADRRFDGYAHREVIVEDPRRGAAMATAFAERGWRVDRLVTMAHRGPPEQVATTDRAVEIDVEDLVAFSREVHRRMLPNVAPAVVDALAGFSRVLRERAGARFFGARIDGALATACELYVHAGAAQIEDVNTLEEFRGQGLAREVVTLAADAARSAGADLVWLIADDNDWPKDFYRKLGFVRVDTFWQFTLADD